MGRECGNLVVSELTAADGAATTLTSAGAPPLLKTELSARLGALRVAVAGRKPTQAGQEAIAAARVAFDFRLRYRPPAEIDRVRFDLWLAQLILDTASGTAGDVRGDTATLELMWDRIAHTFDAGATADLRSRLAELRSAANASDLTRAGAAAKGLRERFAAFGWR